MARKSSFYYAFLVLPAARRRAILAVFDFCRAVDDSVDFATDSATAAAAVAQWRREVALVFQRGQPETAEGRGLQACVVQFGLEREHFDALVDGVEMDLAPREYRTFADLEQYCHRVASAVGLMSIPIFGCTSPAAREYARDLGVALQLTNILRDVAVDYRRGRVYLPVEDLERFGCSVEHIDREVAAPGAGVRSEPLRRVLEHQAARARIFFARAARALPRDEARGLLPAEIMRAIYWNLLERIEDAQCDVFGRVIRVPKPVQARMAISTWWALRARASRP
ncbi:MAG: squalene/phytoene synthase family protein [Acidobacteria bacterium]|nr:squalene/phytoene synthase family protein [Acidobacteriota bacterium]